MEITPEIWALTGSGVGLGGSLLLVVRWLWKRISEGTVTISLSSSSGEELVKENEQLRIEKKVLEEMLEERSEEGATWRDKYIERLESELTPPGSES